MHKARVSIAKISNYENKELSIALKKSLDLLGGLESIVKPRSKVFVKINYLSPPSLPEKAIITHPAFTREVLHLLKNLDCEITVGDDIQSKVKDGFRVSGYRKMCDELGVRLINLKESGFEEISCKGQLLVKTYVSPQVLEADCVVNLPKLKTHSFTVFTGAIKNMFGIIPYGLRLNYHSQYSKNDVFSQMLVDIFSCAPPRLTIMDGIVAMEGEGPGGGSPRDVKVLLASQDAIAVDAVATKIIGFNPMDIFTIRYAHERGLGIGKIGEIEIKGERIRDVEVRNFKHSTIAVGLLQRRIPRFLYAYIQGRMELIPEILMDKCTGCMECIDICPREAAKLNQAKAWIDKSLCIHCMCCHEVCRFQAIKLKQRPVGKIVRGANSFYRMAKSLFF